MAQKVGSREKLAQKEGRREIYSPVPPPSLASCVFTPVSSQYYSKLWPCAYTAITDTRIIADTRYYRQDPDPSESSRSRGLTESGSDY